MKPIRMFMLPSCPYCISADRMMNQLVKENPAYSDIPVERINESAQKALADSFDYYYVPTYYVDGKKLHEGAATREDIRRVLDTALKG